MKKSLEIGRIKVLTFDDQLMIREFTEVAMGRVRSLFGQAEMGVDTR